MTDPFDGPGNTAGIDWNSNQGRLFLITPHEVLPDFKTALGTGPTIRADVTILDGPDGPVDFIDTLIFPKVLQSQVRSNAGTGRKNLGRLGQGEKKPNQSAPWMLSEPTDADKTLARRHLAAADTARPPF